MEHSLWVEKYRPKTVEECILPPRIKDFFSSQIANNDLQHMLLIGGAGCGKTTIAKAICYEMGVDILFKNASEDRGIDLVRNEVRGFASTVSFSDGKIKCIILDEADYLTDNAQVALRSLIEEFSQNCRFIFTANFPNRIISPIKSRCAVVDFNLSKEEKSNSVIGINKRIISVLENEGIHYDKKTLAEIIIRYFPDFRKILLEVQRNCHTGRLIATSFSDVGDEAISQLIGHLKDKDFRKMREWVIQNSDIDFSLLIKTLFDKMGQLINKDDIPDFILILNKYDYQASFCMNKEINTTAMLCDIYGNIDFQ